MPRHYSDSDQIAAVDRDENGKETISWPSHVPPGTRSEALALVCQDDHEYFSEYAAAVLEQARYLIQYAAEAEEAEKQAHEQREAEYAAALALGGVKDLIADAVIVAGEKHGWALDHQNRSYGGFGSYYIYFDHEESGESMKIRIADHYAPKGSGFSENKQEYHQEPDVNLVVDSGTTTEDFDFDIIFK